mmetsp:Transcript_7650/g.13817  ORF Transcript_7650/g.13817 Transcript_7650/m.13817 type:complete len:90 (-) Transcript_7650:1047-1316(-)
MLLFPPKIQSGQVNILKGQTTPTFHANLITPNPYLMNIKTPKNLMTLSTTHSDSLTHVSKYLASGRVSLRLAQDSESRLIALNLTFFNV